LSKNHLDSLKKENQILNVVSGEFVVKAIFTFTHENFICFVMEFMRGGDLGSLLERMVRFEEEMARFYIAETILAVESLHRDNIIHRDLKPDNILLDKDGHIKLTDFGLSDLGFIVQKKKQQSAAIFEGAQLKPHFNEENMEEDGVEWGLWKSINFKTSLPELAGRGKGSSSMIWGSLSKSKSRLQQKIVGTPDYMAVEILDGEGLRNPVIDWWSVGVMLFEFLVGVPPFNDETREQVPKTQLLFFY
jgi:serine/threonine protein kinase